MLIEGFLNNALTNAPLPGDAAAVNPINFDGLIDPALMDGDELPDPQNIQVDPQPRRRRRRSELGDDMEEAESHKERQARLTRFTEEAMDRHNLEGEVRNTVRRMAEVSII